MIGQQYKQRNFTQKKKKQQQQHLNSLEYTNFPTYMYHTDIWWKITHWPPKAYKLPNFLYLSNT